MAMTSLERDAVRNALTFYIAHWTREAKGLDAMAAQFDCAATATDADNARTNVKRAQNAYLAFVIETKGL